MGIGITFIINNSGFPLFTGIKPIIDAALLLTLIMAAYFLYALYIFLNFPLLFMIGYQKGKFVSIPSYLIIFFSLMIPSVIFEGGGQESTICKLQKFAAENTFLLNVIIFIAATVILALSYFISVKIYSKREF